MLNVFKSFRQSRDSYCRSIYLSDFFWTASLIRRFNAFIGFGAATLARTCTNDTGVATPLSLAPAPASSAASPKAKQSSASVIIARLADSATFLRISTPIHTDRNNNSSGRLLNFTLHTEV